LEILDDVDVVPEREMLLNKSDRQINNVSAVESVEATQPPTLSPYTPNLTQNNNGDFTANPRYWDITHNIKKIT